MQNIHNLEKYPFFDNQRLSNFDFGFSRIDSVSKSFIFVLWSVVSGVVKIAFDNLIWKKIFGQFVGERSRYFKFPNKNEIFNLYVISQILGKKSSFVIWLMKKNRDKEFLRADGDNVEIVEAAKHNPYSIMEPKIYIFSLSSIIMKHWQ